MLTSMSGLLNGNPGSITLLKKTEPGALQLIMRTIMNGIALNNYKKSILDTSLIESKKKKNILKNKKKTHFIIFDIKKKTINSILIPK
jgi:hypothetical protein